MTANRLFGGHVSASGGLLSAIQRANSLNITAVQIHPTAPQRYVTKPYATGLEIETLSFLPNTSVKSIFFHSIYLINLANPDTEKQKLGINSLVYDLEFSSRLKASGVIFHVGSLKDEPSEEQGLKRCARAISEILERTPDDSRLLLEVSAGSGKVIGSKLEQLGFIYNEVNNPTRLGFALDTQHMWASGYDWQNNLEAIVKDLEVNFGIENIDAIHLNDSKSELASKVDRHANLGEGTIGIETLANVINHPKLNHIPLLLETPCMASVEEARTDVEILRQLVNRENVI